MIKYNRKDINKNTLLHDKQFLVTEDVIQIMATLAGIAIDCGADEESMLDYLERSTKNEKT